MSDPDKSSDTTPASKAPQSDVIEQAAKVMHATVCCPCDPQGCDVSEVAELGYARALADAHLLADPADRDEIRSQLRRARRQCDEEREAKEGNWKALGEWSKRAERAEAEVTELQGRLSELLDNLTGGRLSKPTYDVRTMVQEVEAYFERTEDDENAELRATVERCKALADEWIKRNPKDWHRFGVQRGIEASRETHAHELRATINGNE